MTSQAGTGARIPAARRADPAARVVALTGACTFLGSELIRRLEEDRRVIKVLALDVRQPAILAAAQDSSARPLKTRFFKIDLTTPTVDGELAEILADEGVDTLVHGAFLSHPTHAAEWAHELEDVGTMHVLNAAAEVLLPRFVMISTTMVYGASPKNPNFLSESHELHGHRESRFIKNRVRAERQVLRFAQENPATQVATLRFAPILGPTADNLFTRFLSRPFTPVMMGYDPLMQFVHEQDAAEALRLAVLGDAEGPFNIVGKGVLPYSTVRALLGRVPVPMPYLIARSLSRALWVTQVFDSPPSFLDFLRFLCVADGARARRELGFQARFNIRRTILDFLGVPADGADSAQAFG
jgi:UDP-glucose 4-epimerase